MTSRTLTARALLLVLTTLGACSDVGPGLKNHPIDCAVGFAWADCLPGTAGYVNGHPQPAADQQQDQSQGQSPADAAEELRTLKKLHDDGVITDQEYETKKAEILNRM